MREVLREERDPREVLSNVRVLAFFVVLFVPITVRKINFMGLCLLGGGMYVSNQYSYMPEYPFSIARAGQENVCQEIVPSYAHVI